MFEVLLFPLKHLFFSDKPSKEENYVRKKQNNREKRAVINFGKGICSINTFDQTHVKSLLYQ